MRQLATQYRILELDLEALAWPDRADRRQGAAEHRHTARQALVAAPAGDQVAWRTDIGQRALLVEHAFAAVPDEAAQYQAVPMRLDLLEAPGHAADRLGADLLGDGDAIALGLAVGMVGAQGHPEPVGGAD